MAMTASEKAAAYRGRQLARGRCVRCGGPRPDGRRVCVPCCRRTAGNKRRLQAARAAAGVCNRCGRRPPSAGAKACVPCIESVREYNERRKP